MDGGLTQQARRPAKDVAEELNISVDLVYQHASRVMKDARALYLAISDEELADAR